MRTPIIIVALVVTVLILAIFLGIDNHKLSVLKHSKKAVDDAKKLGAMLLSTVFPSSKDWSSASSDANDLVLGTKPNTGAAMTPGYLGAMAPLIGEAYGGANPVFTTPSDDLSPQEQAIGSAASAEYDAAARANTLQAAIGSDGLGTDYVGATGSSLADVYGNAMRVPSDTGEADAAAARDADPIKGTHNYSEAYDAETDAISLRDAYGSQYVTDGAMPALGASLSPAMLMATDTSVLFPDVISYPKYNNLLRDAPAGPSHNLFLGTKRRSADDLVGAPLNLLQQAHSSAGAAMKRLYGDEGVSRKSNLYGDQGIPAGGNMYVRSGAAIEDLPGGGKYVRSGVSAY